MRRNDKTVALIGFGAIGRVLAGQLISNAQGPRLVGVLARSSQDEVRSSLPEDVAVLASIDELLALAPDIVAECAGQEALLGYAPTLLCAGIDVMVISTGALARPGILDDWMARAQTSGARLLIPAGAIAGLDGLGAHRLAGLSKVFYTSAKPPIAWRGTPAEDLLSLETLRQRTVFFEGSAREAAVSYPKNANLAATVALAGMGLDETRVRLVADPTAIGNTGVIEAESPIGTMRVEMAGKASANPQTSASTAYSLAHALSNLTSTVVI
jgi:aspartate dehydrogenase